MVPCAATKRLSTRYIIACTSIANIAAQQAQLWYIDKLE